MINRIKKLGLRLFYPWRWLRGVVMKKGQEQSIEAKTYPVQNELLGLLLLSLSLLLILALLSFSEEDLKIKVASEGGLHNWMGFVGAKVSLNLLIIFGGWALL